MLGVEPWTRESCFPAAIGAPATAARVRWVLHLRRHHVEVWKRLGQPRPWLLDSIAVQLRTRRFVKTKEHEGLGDLRFNELTERLVFWHRAYAAALGVSLLVAIASMLLHRSAQ